MFAVAPKFNNRTFPKERDVPTWRDEAGVRYVFDGSLRAPRKRTFGFHFKAPNCNSLPLTNRPVNLQRKWDDGEELMFEVVSVQIVQHPIRDAERGPMFAGPISKTFGSRNVGVAFLRMRDDSSPFYGYDAALRDPRMRRGVRDADTDEMIEETPEDEEEGDVIVAIPTTPLPLRAPARLAPLQTPRPRLGTIRGRPTESVSPRGTQKRTRYITAGEPSGSGGSGG